MSFPFDLHSAAGSDSHLPCHAMLCCGLEKSDMVRTWHGRGMVSVNQTQPHCVNQMGKTHSKPLAVWHGRGTAWARHGHGMLCVNRPLRNNSLHAYVYKICAKIIIRHLNILREASIHKELF